MHHVDLSQELRDVIEKYRLEYKSDPHCLRSAIPPEEIWRFFTEESVQRYGAGLTQLPIYDTFIKQHLHSTFADIQALGPMVNKKFTKASAAFIKEYYQSHPHESYQNGKHRLTDEYKKLQETFKMECSMLDQFEDHIEKLKFSQFITCRQQYTLSDLIKLDKGWVTFELPGKEQGYFNALYRAFDMIFDNRDKMTISHIVALHRQASEKVKHYNHCYIPDIQFFHAHSTHRFGLKSANSTLDGLKQLLQKEKPYHIIRVRTIKGENKCFPCKKEHMEEIETAFKEGSFIVIESALNNDQTASLELQKLIDQYYLKVNNTDNKIDKLRAMIDFTLDCVQLHPFGDGNCRTFVMLLLNELLMANQFPFVMLRDANCFGCYSTDELLKEVVDGMKNVFALIQNKSLFDVKTAAIIQDLNDIVDQHTGYALSCDFERRCKHDDANNGLRLYAELTQLEKGFRQSRSYSANQTNAYKI